MRLVALVLLAASGAFAAERPVFRFGIMSDTHIGNDAASCSRARDAFELFRREKCAVIVHNGDIAEKFSHDGYRALRGIVDEVFTGSSEKPKEIWTYAWHDAYAWNDRPRSEVYDHAAEAWPDLKKDLRIPHGHTDAFVFGGYTFLLFPQFVGMKGFLSWAEYEKKVSEACQANPGKPVFVIDHVPPQGTVHDTGHWGDPRRRTLFAKYPQVVLLTGHTHGSVRSERQIWQGPFTVLNAGCLQRWSSLLVGNDRADNPDSFGVLTVDVRKKGLTIRRWDVRDGMEVGKPWHVPFPFDAATAPWNPSRRAKTVLAPQFAAGAVVAVSAADGRNSAFDVSFPAVADADAFRVEALVRGTDGKWVVLTRCDALGSWWQLPKDRPLRLVSRFDSAFFRPGVEYGFRVSPVNAYGVAGRAVETSFTMPAELPQREVIWSSNDLKCETVLKPFSSFRLPLPDGTFDAPKGTKFICIVEVETDEGEDWNRPMIRLAPGSGLSGGGSRQVLLAESAAGRVCYLLTFWKGEKSQTPDTYDLLLDYGAGTHVRFGSCRIYKLK